MTSQASSSTTTNKIYLILLRRSKAFHKGKIVSKNCNISKTPGRDFIDPQLPPPPLCHGGGMNLLVRPRVKTPDRRLISNPEFFCSLFPSRPQRFQMWRHLSILSGKITLSRYRTRLQASSGNSDSVNWPGYQAEFFGCLCKYVRGKPYLTATTIFFRCPECRHLCLSVRSLGCS